MERADTHKRDVGFTLAKNIVGVDYECLPSEVVEITKMSILDTLGVILAASGIVPDVRGLVDLIKEAGGKKESTIIGFGGRVPAWMAAFLNGAMAHCLDYDDLNQDIALHPSTPTVPCGFAIAERLGRVTGKELIAAVALGNDLGTRLGETIDWKFDWFTTPLFGYFSAAATSGKLLRLDEDRMLSALGIAFVQAAGTMEMRISVESNIAGIYSAWPNKAGVLAALMAERGIRGIENLFEGKAGLFNLYFKGEYRREPLTAGLGKKFEGAKVSFKPWPSCGGTHQAIDGTLRIVAEHDICPDDIDEITVRFSSEGVRDLCEPLPARQKPATAMDAKFSIPFVTAVAAVKRRVTLKDFISEAIRDPAVLRIAQRTRARYDPGLKVGPVLGLGPYVVAIKTRGGKTYSEQVDYPYGRSPYKPMARDDIIEKFRDCASYAVRPLPRENIDKVIELVTHLEKVRNVSRIIRLLG